MSDPAFVSTEEEIRKALSDKSALLSLWRQLDYNGNGIVSVAEVDKFLGERFPVLQHQPTIIRAFKYTTLVEGDKDSWVEKFEFPFLLRNLLYFHKLYVIFNQLDDDGDHRVSLEEFKKNLDILGLHMSPSQAEAEFRLLDADGHGMILFDELCRWYAVKARPVDGEVHKEFTKPTDGAKTRSAEKKAMIDRDPDIHTRKFKKVEAKIQRLMSDKNRMTAAWKVLDFNGNGIVSLAEIDRFVTEMYPMLKSARALMRAYKYTTLIDGDGDEWVEPAEFPALLRNIVYFNKLYDTFDQMDQDGDHRLTLEEFIKALDLIGLALPKKDAEIEFMAMDSNSGGVVLFDEFAAWVASRKCPVDDDVRNHFVAASVEMRRATGSSSTGPSTASKKAPSKPASKFVGLHKQLRRIASDPKKLKLLWRKLDRSADGHLTLRELSNYMSEKYPLLGRKPALKRAFEYTISKDTSDDNSTIEENELPALLENVVLFHKVLATFDTLDKDNSKQLDMDEFSAGLEMMSLSGGKDVDTEAFQSADPDGKGTVSLDGFASFILKHKDRLLTPSD
eukprot:m.82579 g.82579  ORF g.82579 m.82579 type:complete len:562 (-) comp14304_c1_seq1:159-1844(-)